MLLQPVPVTVTVLGVAVTTIGVLSCVFLPQQLLGHPFTLEFLVDSGPVGHLIASRCGGIGTGIEQGRKAAIVHILGQRPVEVQGIGPGQQLLDGPDTGLGAGADLPDREPGFQSQAKHLSDFTHWNSLCWHNSAPQKKRNQSSKRLNKQCVKKDSG